MAVSKATAEGRKAGGFSRWLNATRGERPEAIYSPLVFVAVVAVWEAGVRLFDVPTILIPPPSTIFQALVRGLWVDPLSRAGYYVHAAYTLWEAFVGFVIGSGLGIVLGILISQSRLVERTLMPYIIAFQALPKIAVAPLFVVWLGFGMTSKILMVIFLAFFPLLINSLVGFKSVPQNRIDLARSLCATRWQIFRYIKLPSAMPFIFAGLDMAAVFSVIGAIVGEFVGAQRGMGVLIMQMQYQMDIPGVFSALLVLALLGLALQASMGLFRRRYVFWALEEEAQQKGKEP